VSSAFGRGAVGGSFGDGFGDAPVMEETGSMNAATAENLEPGRTIKTYTALEQQVSTPADTSQL
jgi:hypothetical protein